MPDLSAGRARIAHPDPTDCVLAGAVALLSLIAYLRTLAPDVLYSDSAEFQTLAYSLSTTHSTGYPIYLLLARVAGLIPIETLAWRINLFSAVSAGAAIGLMYLATRYITPSRTAALFVSATLALSYTFWSQAIIAEVYAPGLTLLAAITVLAFHWHAAPYERTWAAFAAGLLWGLGLGVHASVWLYLPALIVLAIWTLATQRSPRARWLRALGAGAGGAMAGMAMFVLAFVLIDLNDLPTSFIRVTMSPSRTIWGLSPADIDSPLERLWITVTGLQWRDAMFPRTASMLDAFGYYLLQVATIEFSPLVVLAAIPGFLAISRAAPSLGAYVLLALSGTLVFVLNYRPGDQYIFFLPTYLPITIAAGATVGIVVEWLIRATDRLDRPAALGVRALGVVLLAAALLGPVVPSRTRALAAGAATFVRQDYAYPIDDLSEPRRIASARIGQLPTAALAVVDWRALYSQYYLAHVEGARPDVAFMEATPHGSEGRLADSLVETLKLALQQGRPVVADRLYDGLLEHFSADRIPGTEWYLLTLKRVGRSERGASPPRRVYPAAAMASASLPKIRIASFSRVSSKMCL
jgi:hypothetical protein